LKFTSSIHFSLFLEASVLIPFRQLTRSFWRFHRLHLALALLAFFGASHPASAQTPTGVAGKLLSSNTKKGYSKSNQSKVFFHDGKWWAMAYAKKEKQWHIWQYSDPTWTAAASAGNTSSSTRPDVVLNAATNKLYIIFSTSDTPAFYRMSYSGGTWNIDSGFPKSLSAFSDTDSKGPVSLVRAANGELWLFRLIASTLEGLRSTDDGNTWSAKFVVKSGLNYKKGTTDTKVFSMGGQSYIGLAYGEEFKAGKSRFGFLYHRDGDAETLWTDESAALTMMGAENATGGINLAADASNNLYLFTQNGNALGTDPRNTLYKRNAATGLWQAFNANVSDTWTSPAIAVQGASKLFLMGINVATSKAEYKTITIGKENLAGGAFTTPLFENGADVFIDLSAPLNAVDGTTQLMVCAENNTMEKIWYSLVTVGSALTCNPPTAEGPAAIADTKGGSSEFYKPNQSKVFFHDGTWWVAAPDAIANEWILLKKQGSAWTKAISLGGPGSIKADCYIDSGNNKLYILAAHGSSTGTKFLRLTYNPDDGTWATDLGFPVTLTGFTYQGENPGVLTRAKNGDFWVFVPRSGVLYARRSADGGLTWSGDITVKNLSVPATALCDAVTFSSNGQNYVGVGFGEDSDPLGRFGFLMHKDGDPDNVWTDETSQIVLPANTQCDDHMAMAVSASNEVFMVIKTHPSLANATGVGLYKRAAIGGWSSCFKVFTGSAETRPAVVVDETNNELYVFTTLLSSPRFGRYKKCTIGNEAALAGAGVNTFFQNALDDFYNVSVPSHRVNSCTGLLVAAENKTNLKTWYQVFPINAGDTTPAGPVVVGNVTVTAATAGQGAAYSLPITLGATNGLTGGSSTITITWPNDTNVPAAIGNTMVTVNGVNATNVITTAASRQAVVTVPNSIAGGATITLIFAAGAGLINPTTAANYSLTVQTSAQPIDATSPPYTIAPAGVVPVTVGNVVVTPDLANSAAGYTIPLTLGAAGALTAGAGTISITWPHDTMVPASIANSAVTVNGANASAVTTNSATRQATVTVPSNLASNALVTLAFTSAAGIKNSTTPGNYTLQAQTSAQPVNANSPSYAINPSAPSQPPSGVTSSVLATRTKSLYDKSSQSKVFYLDNKWWTMAQDSADSKWYLFGGTAASAAWTRGLKIDSRAGTRADMIVDAANNRLYVLCSQGTTSYFNRLLYAGDNWTLEAQIPLAGFDHGDGANVVTIARAKNNYLWMFRINSNALEAQVSTNDGNTWSATMQLKTGLSGKYGQTDAVAFSAGGNYVGVVYGLAASSGGAPFGFLKHRDGDPNTTWTDETAQLSFFGTERADSWVSANALNDGTVYFITRNSPGTAGIDPNNTLYKRSSGGAWNKFKVNTSTTWTSPTLAIDASNNRLFVMGIRTGAPNIGEYKLCAFGNEGSLESATPTTLLQNNSDNFGHLSAPLAAATNATGLLVVGSNVTTDDLWHAKINFGAPKNAALAAELQRQREAAIDNFTAAQVYPNPFNPVTTIKFAVQAPATVKLQIFNMKGELVRTLADGELSRGLYEKRWNGHDDTGRQVASGLYFYRLQIGAKVLNGRMQMVK
jgi:hypothetical protein